MHVAVIALPSLLPHDSFSGRAVVVLDVLRATTTIACALDAGALEVRTYPSLGAAREAHASFPGPRVLAGERDCLRPAGFDLGNSPLEMTPQAVGGKVVFLTTTNGTRALRVAFDHPMLLRDASGSRPPCYVAALVNAGATAGQLAQEGRDILLLCAGSDGAVAEEDLIGAGAIIARLRELGAEPGVADDAGAEGRFARFQREGPDLLKRTRGGRRLLGAGLREDLHPCARLDSVPLVCRVDGRLWIRAEQQVRLTQTSV